MKRKIITILMSFLLVLVVLTGISIADENDRAPEGEYYGEDGPAPNAGDGIPDGSGFDHEDPIGPDNGPGPAPSSGDGDSDGPGW